MDSVNQIANEFGLTVIEDACQAHGAYYPTAVVARIAGALAGSGIQFLSRKTLVLSRWSAYHR